MTQPIIGIAANEIQDSGEVLHNLPLTYTPHGYIEAVQRAGGLPVVLPIGTVADAQRYVSQIDKLVLAGGQNVLPRYYGEEITVDGSFLEKRDVFEMALIEAALAMNKPIFAICRGMQLVNVYFGGTLSQDVMSETTMSHMQAPLDRRVASHHLRTATDSWIQPIYGEETEVNSFHYQAVKQLATNFTPTAWSDDETIEAIEDRTRRILGVQWHPDFAYDVCPQEQAIFDFVVKKL